ncbi:hypothetical protein B566_EDAN003330 [Ephemera danica]|nr:hypothetical protein B566_EDAN003330 [Ephemera danica]
MRQMQRSVLLGRWRKLTVKHQQEQDDMNIQTQILAKTGLVIWASLILGTPVEAQVNLPNGGVSENVVDLRVKTVGGLITVDRQFEDGRWHINLRWAPATLGGEVVGSMTCKAYPELKIQGLPYTGDGQSWLRENRYSVRAFGKTNVVLEKVENNLRFPGQYYDQETNTHYNYFRDYEPGTGRYVQRDPIGLRGGINGFVYALANPLTKADINGLQSFDRFNRCAKFRWGDHYNRENGSVSDVVHLSNIGLLDDFKRTPSVLAGVDRVMRLARSRLISDLKSKCPSNQCIPNDGVTSSVEMRDVEGLTCGKQSLYPLPNNPNQPSPKAAPASRSALRQRSPGIRADLATFFICVLLGLPLPSTAQVNLPNGGVSENVVDLRVKTITKETRKGQAGAPDAAWQFAFDDQGQISQTTDPEGHIRRYQYDRFGNLLAYTDPRGNTTRYEVDAEGNLTKETNPLGHSRSYAYDKVGNLTSETDARGKATLKVYDAMNRLLQSTNPIGGVAKVQYNAQGLPITEIDEDGRRNQIEYDNFDRIAKQLDPLGNAVQFGYQINDGSAAVQLGSLGEPTQVDYPSFSQINRFDSRERPTTQSLKYRNAQGEQTTTNTVTYDKRGQVLTETDANGNTRTHRYNALGLRVETTDALNGKTRYSFDVAGNLLEMTDAKSNTYQFEYDRNDHVVKETLPLGQVTQYQYDAAGNLSKKIDPLGNQHIITRDAANRVTQIEQKGADGTLLRTTTQTGDASGHLTAWSDTDHSRSQTSSATLSYDDAGRKVSETITYPSGTTLGYQYSYSLAGKKTRLTWPDGTVIDYGYSAHGELETVSIPGEGTISVSEYAWNAPKKTLLPGGGTQNRSFDGLLNLENLSTKTPSQQTTLNLDNRFGKLQELNNRSRTDTGNNLSTTKTEQFSFDADNRLTQVQTDSGGLFGSDTERYTLDAVGNRIGHSKVSGAWAYDANNRLMQIGSGSCGQSGVTCYQYNSAGNLTQKQTAARTIQYRYDTQNRLLQVTDGSGQLIARYGYDPVDRRLWKEQFRDKDGQPLTQAQRTHYLYADEGLIAEATQAIILNQDGSTTASAAPQITTQYGPKPESQFTTGMLFIKTKNSNGQDTVAYYHHDHLETPIQATDKAGNIVWAAHYAAFGNATIITPQATAEKPTITSNLRLPGQYEDAETGLHYNFRRYYDPETGRYVTQDPIGLAGGVNVYGYVGGNPISRIDPTGEIWAVAALVITGAVIVGTLYAMHDCGVKCKGICNADCDESGECRQKITKCQLACVKGFTMFLQKYASPTPPAGIFEK